MINIKDPIKVIFDHGYRVTGLSIQLTGWFCSAVDITMCREINKVLYNPSYMYSSICIGSTGDLAEWLRRRS